MKKILLLATMALFACTGLKAQEGYIFINSEKVFKSQEDYNLAIQTLDQLSQEAQKRIDDTYARMEQLFNTFQSQRQFLTEQARKEREDEIINMERDITKFQEETMGENGSLMQQRLALIKPIQDRIFGAINKYAETNGIGMVVDITNNMSVLYYSPKLDKTDDIINLLKK